MKIKNTAVRNLCYSTSNRNFCWKTFCGLSIKAER